MSYLLVVVVLLGWLVVFESCGGWLVGGVVFVAAVGVLYKEVFRSHNTRPANAPTNPAKNRKKKRTARLLLAPHELRVGVAADGAHEQVVRERADLLQAHEHDVVDAARAPRAVVVVVCA
jgi:hypothetical protein